MKAGLFTLMLASGVAALATAGTKKTVKTTRPFHMLEAYTQNKVSGIPGGVKEEGHHFVIIWDAKANTPESFFWRGESGWMNCIVEKAHKLTKAELKTAPSGSCYSMADVEAENVKKGDTLMLTPLRGGKFPVPAEIPASAKNTLYYKVAGGKWKPFPVKNITKKKDIVNQ